MVMYSIGNEIPNQLDPKGGEIARKLVDICHAEDLTRPVTSGCDQIFSAGLNGFIDLFDISGFNYIDRQHKDKMY